MLLGYTAAKSSHWEKWMVFYKQGSRMITWQLCDFATEYQNSDFNKCFHSTTAPWVTWDYSGFTSSGKCFIHAELGE